MYCVFLLPFIKINILNILYNNPMSHKMNTFTIIYNMLWIYNSFDIPIRNGSKIVLFIVSVSVLKSPYLSWVLCGHLYLSIWVRNFRRNTKSGHIVLESSNVQQSLSPRQQFISGGSCGHAWNWFSQFHCMSFSKVTFTSANAVGECREFLRSLWIKFHGVGAAHFISAKRFSNLHELIYPKAEYRSLIPPHIAKSTGNYWLIDI